MLIKLSTAVLFFTFSFSMFAQNRVPHWAKKAVWYQIFPERFSNGDKNNDPQSTDLINSWPNFVPKGWQIIPWTSDWYKFQPWEKADGHDFYWNAGTRRYGGDLQGVIDKLDYLKSLGINAIYLNPIFESPSLHKYDAAMYRHVDNNFGPNPTKDKKIWATENPEDPSTWKWTTADSLFLTLLQQAHNRNIRIIIDGVFNHVGTQFWAFKDIVKNQQKSKYKNWFTIKSFDNPSTEKNEFDYAGWLGIKSLPEFKEDENGIVKGPREHIHNIVKRWMDPNGDGNPSDGIDGWRLDVAEMVNHNFWKDFRKWGKGINPNAYIVGEIWWQDWQHNIMFNATPWLQGDEFDAVMNYRFARALKRFVADKKLNCGMQGFIDSLKTQYQNYNKENLYVLMNLLDSHDTERLASLIVNPDHLYDHYANPQQNKNWKVRKPNSEERAKQKLMVAIQMTLPGAPQIYYGDEAGMWGGDDPDDRKPMVWPEFKYDTETASPFGKIRSADTVKFDSSLFNWYQKLISIRRSNPELMLGDIKFNVIDKAKGLLAYKRNYNNKTSFIIANNSSKENKLKISSDKFFGSQSSYVELISQNKFSKDSEIILQPYQILIMK